MLKALATHAASSFCVLSVGLLRGTPEAESVCQGGGGACWISCKRAVLPVLPVF